MTETNDPIEQALGAARALVARGRADDAAKLYRVILKHLPGHPETSRELAAIDAAGPQLVDPPPEVLQPVIALHAAGRMQEALTAALAIAETYPASPVLANIVGVLSLHLGRKEAAVGAFRQALALKPSFVEVTLNLGTLLCEMGDFATALTYLQVAHRINPQNGAVLAGLALAEAGAGQHEQALATYQRALAADPLQPGAHNNLGTLLSQLARHRDAVASFAEAIRLKPDFVEAYCNLGNALSTLGQAAEAEAAFRKALDLNPVLPDVHANLANMLADLGRDEEALQRFDTALALSPDNLALQSRALHQRALMCRWDDVREASLRKLAACSRDVAGVLPAPFNFLTQVDDTLVQRDIAAASLSRDLATIHPAGDFSPPAGDGRIRIGYFSADFHEHATMYLMARLFELHDRERFEVHTFSFGPDSDDAMRRRLLDAVEHFHDVTPMSPQAIAEHSRALGIDIAVDLKGFTRDARPQIFLHRAAPVQVNYLGYPGTCGSDAWDYIIADHAIIPVGHEPGYAEQVVRMPASYQVNDDTRPIAARRFTRVECGLPESGFVFACFNSSYKITPVEFDIWMRLLRAVDGSVLWLLAGPGEAVANLRREAQLRGVDPARLVFAQRMPVPEHLARQQLADLFLDTFVVNAHTTASDALWAGLPVLTCPGDSFAARVAASLVKAAGLPELVVSSHHDYKMRALEFASDPDRLANIRARLQAAPARLPLFDSASCVRSLEKAYSIMADRYRRNMAPEHFDV